MPTMHGDLSWLQIPSLPHTCTLIKCQDRRPTLYLLHRGRRGAGPCASNPSSFSGEASGLSWIPHGSSPQIPADEQSAECTSMGLHSGQNTTVCIHVCTQSPKSTLQLGDSPHSSPKAQPLWPLAVQLWLLYLENCCLHKAQFWPCMGR